LDWILDLYDDEREIVMNGQTIVYTMHHSIGHLGIFVSGKVATREHGEFVSCMELIDVLPPGLYEAVITDIDENTVNPELLDGKYLFRLETRTLDDIRALGGNDADDDKRFATAARVSQINLGLYRTLAAPAVRMAVTQSAAETLRATHPNRLRFAMFSDRNPAMQPVQALAESVRATRQPVSEDNPLRAIENAMSSWVTAYLQAIGEYRDAMTEAVFLNTYGSPLLQALVGLGEPQHKIERDLVREAEATRLRSDLEHRFDAGGLTEATLRALVYIRLPEGSIDERGFSVLKLIRASRPAHQRISDSQFKAMMREQYLLVCLDAERAFTALPKLLGTDVTERKAALDALHRILAARGDLSDEARRRLARVEAAFDVKPEKVSKAESAHA
jgi:hypothetical protein